MNKSTNIIFALIIIAVIGVGSFMFLGSSDKDSDDQSSSTQSSQQSGSESAAKTDKFTTEEVAAHNTEDDCWTIINGKVYDITSYVPRHPGGDEILQACGADGTTLFTQRKTTDGQEVGSGEPHSSSAQNSLEQLEIGSLSN